MAPVEVREGELAHEGLRPACLLVDLDRLAGAHHPQFRMRTLDPGLGFHRFGVDHHDRMARADARLGRAAEDIAELRRDGLPVLEWVGRVERQLARPGGSGVAVDGNPGAIGSAVAHLREHRGQVLAERAFDLRRFREEPDDSAHGSNLPTEFRVAPG
jgi:hypothetical protein